MAKEEKKNEVITAVYKAYMHCPQCADDIQKPLLKIPGVHKVDAKFEKGEVTVKGAIDAKKVQEKLQKWSKKKVELKSETESKDEVKKENIKTITMKVYLHCDQCEREARKRLMMHKGIHNVKTDIKAERITIEGVLEPEKLLTYMRKRVHKYAELIVPEKKKEDKKEENKEKGKGYDEENKQFKFKEVNKVEAKNKEGEVAYLIHYVYAPQMFSDENPDACSIM